MSDTIRNAILFLIDTLFNLYLFILVIRIVLVWVKSDYFNPVTQFVIKMTDVIIKPMKRFIPNINNIETASIVTLFILEMIKFLLITSISYGFPNILGLPILAFADIAYLFIQTMTYAIILLVILGFMQPRSPLAYTLAKFTSPIMRPLQKIIPPVSGFDLSPLFALIILQLISIVLVGPLMALGQGVSLG